MAGGLTHRGSFVDTAVTIITKAKPIKRMRPVCSSRLLFWTVKALLAKVGEVSLRPLFDTNM